ncbi:MAG: hypothetical protein HOP14_03190 [Acidobacteria bacterium]|nr:hypothetical protein [Acidobacteriota bacterium]
MSRIRAITLILASLAPLAGCGGNNAVDPGVTQPTPATITETFAGTLSPNGASTFPFAVGAASTVTASMTELAPEGVSVGLSIGTWNGQTCQVTIDDGAAVLNTLVVGVTSSQGNLCLRVYDPGKLTASATFLVTVVHQ